MKVLSFSQRETRTRRAQRQQPIRNVSVKEPLAWWEILLRDSIVAVVCFVLLAGMLHLPVVGEKTAAVVGQELNREPDWFGLQQGIWQAFQENPLAALPAMGQGEQNDLILEMPVRGVVSSPFGSRVNPETNLLEEHKGIDFDVRLGTAVGAALPGTVLSVGEEQDYGLLVRVEHENGYVTYYAHLLRAAVRAGDVVTGTQTVGWSGNSGLSTGAHLHFELRQNDTPIDPSPYLR